MALLHEIQTSLLDQNIGVGSILYKVRFLAAKLEVDVLEEWVRYEANGYPKDVEPPEYRLAEVSYTGTFTNGVQILNNNAIPTHIIKNVVGKHWTQIYIRDSLSVIDDTTKGKENGFGINASNLKLLLDDKVYQGFNCIEVNSRIDSGIFSRIQHAVRSRLLDFSIALEKNVPAAATIEVGSVGKNLSTSEKAEIASITNITVMGDMHNLQSSGAEAQITLQIAKGDSDQLLKALTSRGIPDSDAKELAETIKNEKPGDSNELGPNTEAKLSKMVTKAASEGWKIGKSVIIELAKSAAKQYWGL